MKKLVYIFMIAAVLVSCKKNTTNEPTPVNQKTQEVTFDISTILESPDRNYSVPNCNDSLDGEINKYACTHSEKAMINPVTGGSS